MGETIQTIAALVAIAATAIGLISWGWRKRVVVRSWIARHIASINKLDAEAEARQLQTLREQVAERARALGIVMAERAVSYNQVVNTDGETITYIRDYQAYQSAMQAGTVDRFRTSPGQRPTALNERDWAWLEKWLEDNPFDGA